MPSLQRAEPGVGSTVQASPNEARSRFTEGSSRLSQGPCSDASGKEVTNVTRIWIAPTYTLDRFRSRNFGSSKPHEVGLGVGLDRYALG